MRNRCFFAISLFLVAGLRMVWAGEGFLIDRELRLNSGFTPVQAFVRNEGSGPAVCLLGEGRLRLYTWDPPILEEWAALGGLAGQAIPLPADRGGCAFLFLLQDGQTYQIWREEEEGWRLAANGGFGLRVTALAGGRFSQGDAAGFFVQFETGRVGYWQLTPDGLLPIWQSPNPWPQVIQARAADLDGDGAEELLAVHGDGALTIARWRGGLWEMVWTLPSWGRVLAMDVGQVDASPGLEAVLVTAQRRAFLIGGGPEGFAVKARLTLNAIAAHAALVPQAGGAILLGDAAGTIELWTPEEGTWRLEARLATGERLLGLAGLAEGRVLAVSALGHLSVFAAKPLKGTAVYLDGEEVGKEGLYWDEGEFYFSPEFLRRTLGIASRWDEKTGSIVLSLGRLSVIMRTGKTEAVIDGRSWPLARGLAVLGKSVFVPADLLRAVFLVNVTYDPALDWLILTRASPGGG